MGATTIRSEFLRVWNSDEPETEPKDLYQVNPKNTSSLLHRSSSCAFPGAAHLPSMERWSSPVVWEYVETPSCHSASQNEKWRWPIINETTNRDDMIVPDIGCFELRL
jgi:hypothetical protein